MKDFELLEVYKGVEITKWFDTDFVVASDIYGDNHWEYSIEDMKEYIDYNNQIF